MTAAEREWHRERCEEFKKEIRIYETYAHTLEAMLKSMCRDHAPTAIVQARAKSFSSYAEKMARKATKYMAQEIGPTDLCGARVITETQVEADNVSNLIRDTFLIDPQNSVDTLARLKTEEFGYRSVHYVVQLNPRKVFGIRVPTTIGDRKAEIQVRTLLQHAHATISHDRLYKTSLHVQERLRRDMARVAALLEECDEEFGICVRDLDSYKLHYGAYMTRDRLAEEIDILERVLQNESDPTQRTGVALRLAQLARATSNYARVMQLLQPFLRVAGKFNTEVLAEYGHALCRVNGDRPKSRAFSRGFKDVDVALQKATFNLRPRILGYRAWAQSRIPDQEKKAREAYRAALEADRSNPFHLASFIEYELFLGETLGPRSVFAPRFELAIRKCRDYIDAGIELPWSFFAMGRFRLLLDQPIECLIAYTKAIELCLAEDSTIPLSALEAELTFIHRISRGREMPESHALVQQLLSLGRVVKTGERSKELLARRPSFLSPVVILAGGTARAFEGNIERYRDVVLEAFRGFTGSIISGGTQAGIAGLAGEIANAEKAKKGGSLEVLGYIPRNLPYDQPVDPRYTETVPSDGLTCGPAHVLQYWTDILLAGIKAQDVRVLGIDGGAIASLEYRLAVALGASVGVLVPPTREAAVLLEDSDWHACRSLIALPPDRRSVQAFVQPPRGALAEDQLERIAEEIHEAYLQEKHYQNPDPAMQPWDKLAEKFKRSNRMQAMASTGLLERAGFRVKSATGKIKPIEFTKQEIEVLAELEHGRWVVERLQGGWRFSEVRDTDKKLHPSLVGWRSLPDAIRDWDRKAVLTWPKLLAEAGLQIIRRK